MPAPLNDEFSLWVLQSTAMIIGEVGRLGKHSLAANPWHVAPSVIFLILVDRSCKDIPDQVRVCIPIWPMRQPAIASNFGRRDDCYLPLSFTHPPDQERHTDNRNQQG